MQNKAKVHPSMYMIYAGAILSAGLFVYTVLFKDVMHCVQDFKVAMVSLLLCVAIILLVIFFDSVTPTPNELRKMNNRIKQDS